MNTLEYKGFIGVVSFNAEMQDYPVLGGYIIGTNNIGFHGRTVEELVKEFHHAVDTCLLDAEGKPIAPKEPPEKHWNYRVIERRNQFGEVYRAIHEVYYTRDVPVSYTKNPVGIQWEVEDPSENGFPAPNDAGQWELERMYRAMLQPVLTDADFRSPPRELRRPRLRMRKRKAVRRKPFWRQMARRYLQRLK